jgi:hypothetical protein
MSTQQVTRIPASQIPLATGKGIQLGGTAPVDEAELAIERRKKRAIEHGKLQEIELMNEETRNQSLKLRNENEQLTRGTGTGTEVTRIPAKGDERPIWQVDEVNLRLRTAKAGETGLTITEAKQALSEVKVDGEEPIVIFNETLGRHVPNPKNPFAKKNMVTAWATAKEYDRQISGGNDVDPMELFINQQEQNARIREAMGINPQSVKTDGEGDMLDRLIKLGLIRPNQDPTEAIAAAIERGLGGRGGPSEEVSQLQKTVESLAAQIQADREARAKEKMDTLQNQVTQLSNELANVKSNKATESEYTIMSKALDTANNGLNGLKDGVFKIFVQPSKPGPADTLEHKKHITGTIAEEAARRNVAIRQGDKLFTSVTSGEPK